MPPPIPQPVSLKSGAPTSAMSSSTSTSRKLNQALFKISRHKPSEQYGISGEKGLRFRSWIKSIVKYGHGFSTQSSLEDDTWGYVVVRTAYGPETDALYAHVREVIDTWVRWETEYELERQMHEVEWQIRYRNSTGSLDFQDIPDDFQFDLTPHKEIRERFRIIEMSDPAALNGASPDEVERKFNSWTLENWAGRFRPDGQGGMYRVQTPIVTGRNAMLRVCILLDRETLEQLASAPVAPRIHDVPRSSLSSGRKNPRDIMEAIGERYWVKLIEARSRDDNDKHGEGCVHRGSEANTNDSDLNPDGGYLTREEGTNTSTHMCGHARLRLNQLIGFWFDRFDEMDLYRCMGDNTAKFPPTDEPRGWWYFEGEDGSPPGDDWRKPGVFAQSVGELKALYEKVVAELRDDKQG